MTANETTNLTGKRAVVTGGSRGIGEAIARRLVEAGAQVVASARSVPDTAPDGVTVVAADMTTSAGVQTLADAALDTLGGVDVIVHNVGGGTPHRSSADITDEQWRQAIDLNFLSAVRLDSALVPGLRERGSGAIVHVSSAAVLTPLAPFLDYTAAKAALESYSRGLALELGPAGIRVNIVSPGRVATPGGEQTRRQWAALDPGGANNPTPLGRDGRPDDIADAVLFLVSDRAQWLTGSNLIVDAGEFPRR